MDMKDVRYKVWWPVFVNLTPLENHQRTRFQVAIYLFIYLLIFGFLFGVKMDLHLCDLRTLFCLYQKYVIMIRNEKNMYI